MRLEPPPPPIGRGPSLRARLAPSLLARMRRQAGSPSTAYPLQPGRVALQPPPVVAASPANRQLPPDREAAERLASIAPWNGGDPHELRTLPSVGRAPADWPACAESCWQREPDCEAEPMMQKDSRLPVWLRGGTAIPQTPGAARRPRSPLHIAPVRLARAQTARAWLEYAFLACLYPDCAVFHPYSATCSPVASSPLAPLRSAPSCRTCPRSARLNLRHSEFRLAPRLQAAEPAPADCDRAARWQSASAGSTGSVG